MRSSSERIGLPTGSQMGFLVIFISPDLVTAIVHVLTSSTKTTGFTHFEKIEKVSSFTNKTSTGKGTCQLIVAITSINPQISMNLVDSACRAWPVQYKNRLREWKTKFFRFWKTEKSCPWGFIFSHFHYLAIHFNMAEAFRAKLEIFEKISENLYCSVCTLIPRQTPIYQTKKRGQIVCAVCKPKSNAKGLIESPLLNDLLASLTIFPCKFRYFWLLKPWPFICF